MDIEVKELNFHYGEQSTLVDISFFLDKAQTLVIYGSSGSGKSTLLRLIAGLEQPANGKIVLKGKTVSSEQVVLSPHKRHCAMIFQQLALWPHMTVDEHLVFGVHRPGKNSIKNKITETLKLFELEDKKICYPAQLSGGEQQRLAIARALITDPQFLLLDEPLSSLDNLLQQKIINLLLLLKRKKDLTMIYVTHSLGEVMQLADRVLVLEQGKQVFFGSKEKFAERFHSSLQQSVTWFTNMEGNNGN